MKWNSLGASIGRVAHRVRIKIMMIKATPTDASPDPSPIQSPTVVDPSTAPTHELNKPHPPEQPASTAEVPAVSHPWPVRRCDRPSTLRVGPPGPTDSLLLNLPGELRMLIWNHLLDDADSQWAFLQELSPLGSGTLSGPNSAPAHMQFLLTCRRIYHDAWHLAWSRVTFHLHSRTEKETEMCMQSILQNRASSLSKEKRRAITRLSISTLLFAKEETSRRRHGQRFSPRAIGMRNYSSLTIWKMKEKPCNQWDGYWFSKQAVKWVMSMSPANCNLNIHLVWTYTEEEVRRNDWCESTFAHSLRRAMHSTSMYSGYRDRVPDDKFMDWGAKTRAVEYQLHQKGKPTPIKNVRVQVLTVRDAIRLGMLSAARPPMFG